MRIGETRALEIGHGIGLAPDNVVKDPEAPILQRCSHPKNVVVAADYPDGAVGLQYAPRLLQPGMGEGVVSAQRIEFVPIIIDRIHAPALGPEQIAAELKIIRWVRSEEHTSELQSLM